MGLWHCRRIDTKVSGSKEGFPLPHSFIIRGIHLPHSGEIALLNAPYTSHNYYRQNLYSQRNIYIAVDGNISIDIDDEKLPGYIIELYQTSGSKGIYSLEGAFSLILYDEDKRCTLLFSSFLTGNPLYYTAKNNLLSVSTNPVYLLRRRDISGTLDAEEISSIFAFDFAALNGSIFSELREVKSGEMVIITTEGIVHKKRLLEKLLPPEHYGCESEIAERYRIMVEKSVKESILPDAEHGIMLSSGMDSSTLAVFAKQQLQAQNRRLRAYSWTLPNDPAGDESKKIKELCRVLDIPLTLFDGEEFGPFDSLDNFLLLPDTPYTNPYWLITARTYSYASSDGIGAIFNGAFGDSLFRGQTDLLSDMIGDGRFDLFLPELYAIMKSYNFRYTVKNSPAIRGLLRSFIPELILKQRRKTPRDTAPWLNTAAREHRRLKYQKRRELFAESGFEQFAWPLSPYLSGYLGMDRYLSGQYGIKRIEPFINTELLNYTLRMPTYMVYRKGMTKYFAREAMKGLLPDSIRLQPRTGLLTSLFYDSYDRNKKTIREMILDGHGIWKEYVDESWMERELAREDDLNPFHLLVFWFSINLQQWQEAIKPGGSLYEGRFEQKIYTAGKKQ